MMPSLKAAKQIGLSLIELLIAIALSMVLMLGAIQVFITTKNSYKINQELSEIQENGRFALNFLARDIRNAGYKGLCITSPVNHITGNDSQLWSHVEGSVFGWSSSSQPDFIPETSKSEGILVQFATGSQGNFEGASTNTVTNPRLNWNGTGLTSPLKSTDIAIISDGLGCDIFSSDTNDAGFIMKNNTKNRNWSHEYTEEFELLKVKSLAYYIADDQGAPSLFRSSYDYDLNPIPSETFALVAGVENIKLEYGIGQDLDLNKAVVTHYVPAASVSSWASVFAIKITLTLKASSGVQKDFSTLVGLRNQLP